ncbi:MAG: redox-regulated ATPase YchF [Desulfurococcales archaeon]|nr:redox-regulated ATPase YchF [Desulfurococcales archaeon]MCE4605550.1 redox-regulated ATPase YchF [Desulfurococcales archaeon]
MVEASNILIGVVGKTNVGKSTFFSAATEVPVEIDNRPFVTIEPNVGVAYARSRCPHIELGLPRCDARNSVCIEGWRMIPVRMMDVAGLVPGAHEGRGLGNQFLDHLRRADVLLLVVDASGSTGPEGVPAKPGTFDPVEEAESMIREIDEWMYRIISRDWSRFAKQIDTGGVIDVPGALAQRLSGLSIRKSHVIEALEATGLMDKKLSTWSSEELRRFIVELRSRAKPIVIVANKADVPAAEEGVKRLRERFGDSVVPASALAELLLKRLAKKGVVRYIPGDPEFQILDGSKIDQKTRRLLEGVRDLVLSRLGGTGVQRAIDKAVFEVLGLVPVYPVDDPGKYTDKEGRILPDVILLPQGSTPRDLAYKIHTDLGKGFLYAVNARNGQRVGESYQLRPGDVIKIVSAR